MTLFIKILYSTPNAMMSISFSHFPKPDQQIHETPRVPYQEG